MEAHLIQHFVPSTCIFSPLRLRLTNSNPKELVGFPLFPRRANMQIGRVCIIPLSKRSVYQDFQGFAKPSRILSGTEANTYTKYVPDDIFSSVILDNSISFYMVELRTSKDFGSCLRDLNAAILLSLINANGDSILQRIPAVSVKQSGHTQGGGLSETVHFQRGSVDIITFKGPKLGKIESLWVGLESGSWRLDGIGLTIINNPLSFPSSIQGTEAEKLEIMQYKFDADNILLGEGGLSIAELRPARITESPIENLSLMKNINSSSVDLKEQSNEESMREYSDLKFSLLLYDLILVFVGSPIVLALTSNERYAYSFFFGGIGGFFYLLLLQKSVDGLTTVDELENLVQGFGRMKGPLFSLALIVAASFVAVKNGIGESSLVLTPADLFVGAAGFLACKIAVVLAAFKPIKRSLEEKE